MKGISIDRDKISKNIDYGFLEEKYKIPINSDIDYDYNIDNLKDVDKAAKLLKNHIDNNSKIIIVTDSDCDGITSAVTLTKGLTEVFGINYKNVITIVNRRKNGNGFNKELVSEVISKINEHGIKLMITADHGSNDNLQFKEIKEATNNVEIILTDHHTIKEFPDVVEAFVNPMRDDSTFDKSISGCTVAYMLLLRTYMLMFKDKNYTALEVLLPYVAVSVIVDCMDISIPYNRLLIKTGLRVMNNRKHLFWETLKYKLGILKYSELDIGMKIGPMINCGNCLNNEVVIYRMLMQTKFEEITEYIEEVTKLNNYRKELTTKYANIVSEHIDKSDNVICSIIDVTEDAIINGKVASNIGSTYNKPTIIFSENKETNSYIGSGRAIVKNLNILHIMDLINKADDTIFKKFGGHEGAFGCNINIDKFDRFKSLFETMFIESHSSDMQDIIIPDAFIPSKDINIKLYEQQQRFAPFGINYEDPIYLSRLRLDRYNLFGNVCKLQFSPIVGIKNKLEGIYFFNDTSVTKDNINNFLNQNVYVVYKLKLNYFRGSYTLSLNILRMELIDG